MNIAKLRTDETASQQGKWFDYDDGARFLIAATNNPAHTKAMGKIAQKRARAVRVDDTDAAEKLFIETLPETVLLGWEGLDDDGKPFPFNRENALRLLRESRPLRDFIVMEANNTANFLKEKEAAVADAVKSPDQVGT